jgi:Cytochrome c oxidase subunit VIa
VIPCIILASINAWNLWDEHWEHWKHMPPLEERIEYPYQNVRTKNYPWGDGDKTLLYVSRQMGPCLVLIWSADEINLTAGMTRSIITKRIRLREKLWAANRLSSSGRECCMGVLEWERSGCTYCFLLPAGHYHQSTFHIHFSRPEALAWSLYLGNV